MCAGVALLLAAAALVIRPELPAASSAGVDAPPLVGVQAHLLWSSVDEQELTAQLDAIRLSGARIVRIDVSWASLQPTAANQWSNWELSRLDRVVQAARSRRLKLLLTFWETPCWASSAPSTLKQGCAGAWWNRGVQRYPPIEPADYGAALAHVVARYGKRVRAWEIWNEPNAQDYFRSPDPARDYAAMVKAGHRAATRADARPLIVAGSLMHADYRFTERLYAHGIKGHFDAFSIHPYSDGRSPRDAGSDQWKHASFIRGVPATRQVMLRHGDDRPLWLTEFGWNTSTVRNDAPWRNGVDEDQQAEYVEQAMTTAAGWDYVDVAIYFGLIDLSGDRSRPNDNFGLLRHDRTEKPAYGAFRRAAAAATVRRVSD